MNDVDTNETPVGVPNDDNEPGTATPAEGNGDENDMNDVDANETPVGVPNEGDDSGDMNDADTNEAPVGVPNEGMTTMI
jgi:hypothetical protein